MKVVATELSLTRLLYTYGPRAPKQSAPLERRWEMGPTWPGEEDMEMLRCPFTFLRMLSFNFSEAADLKFTKPSLLENSAFWPSLSTSCFLRMGFSSDFPREVVPKPDDSRPDVCPSRSSRTEATSGGPAEDQLQRFVVRVLAQKVGAAP